MWRAINCCPIARQFGARLRPIGAQTQVHPEVTGMMRPALGLLVLLAALLSLQQLISAEQQWVPALVLP